MSKIGASSPRSLRIAARTAVAAALVAGTSAAFATSAHAATVHANPAAAAACASGSLQPNTITNGNSGGDVFTSGTAQVTVNGATVTFTPNGTTSQLTVTQSGAFNKVQGACETLSNTGGTSTLANSTLGTCSFQNYDYTVDTTGATVLNVLLRCTIAGTMTISTSSVIGFGNSGAATPELGSGELLATGLLPLGIFLYRRRRHSAAK